MCPVPLRFDYSLLFAKALLSVRIVGLFLYGEDRSRWDWALWVRFVNVLSYFRLRKGACDCKSPTARLGQQAGSSLQQKLQGWVFFLVFNGMCFWRYVFNFKNVHSEDKVSPIVVGCAKNPCGKVLFSCLSRA